MSEQRADAAELELLLDVEVDVRELAQVRLDHSEQPLIARMALHPDAQRAALAARDLTEHVLGVLELGQEPLR